MLAYYIDDITLIRPGENEVATTPGLLVRVRESIPKQVDKKSGVSEEWEGEREIEGEGKGVWGSQGGERSGILKEEERTNMFSFVFSLFIP